MKTITLETARALKAAFDQAEIEMPETEKGYRHRYTESGDDYRLKPYRDGTIPAPDAEELGKWVPYSLWHGYYLEIGKDRRGYYSCYSTSSGATIFVGNERSNTIAEALSPLMIACLEADPDQIREHLQALDVTGQNEQSVEDID